MVEDLVINHNLSIIAFDEMKGIPLGVALNGVMEEEEVKVTREEVY